MQITLPVSKKTLEIPIFSHKIGRELEKMQRAALENIDIQVIGEESLLEKWLQYRDEKLRTVIYKVIPTTELDDMPQRDVALLFTVTYRYNMGDPVAAIKNLLAGGDGDEIASVQTTAQTVQ